jgi:predicted  nucleic acid-binding Zn-ribbon protein
MSVLRELYQLQLVDSEREDKGLRLTEVKASIGESGEVVRAQQAIVETEASLNGMKVQLRDLELAIKGIEAKLAKNQERLYSGRVRNPKELSNLQEEASSLRHRQSDLEEHQLELMIGIEEEEAELAERQARLHQIEATWRADQDSLLAEKEELESRLAELEDERTAKRAHLGVADLAMYDDLRNRLGGTGVVLLRGGICQACGVDVPTGVARAVERGGDVNFCPTCDRLLYGGV